MIATIILYMTFCKHSSRTQTGVKVSSIILKDKLVLVTSSFYDVKAV